VHVKGAHIEGGRHIVLQGGERVLSQPGARLALGQALFLPARANPGPRRGCSRSRLLTDSARPAAVARRSSTGAQGHARGCWWEPAVGATPGASSRWSADAARPVTLGSRTRERARSARARGSVKPSIRRSAGARVGCPRPRLMRDRDGQDDGLVMALRAWAGDTVLRWERDPERSSSSRPCCRGGQDRGGPRLQTERYGNLHHAIAAASDSRKGLWGAGDPRRGRLPGRERARVRLRCGPDRRSGVQDARIAQAVVEVLGLDAQRASGNRLVESLGFTPGAPAAAARRCGLLCASPICYLYGDRAPSGYAVTYRRHRLVLTAQCRRTTCRSLRIWLAAVAGLAMGTGSSPHPSCWSRCGSSRKDWRLPFPSRPLRDDADSGAGCRQQLHEFWTRHEGERVAVIRQLDVTMVTR